MEYIKALIEKKLSIEHVDETKTNEMEEENMSQLVDLLVYK